MAQTPNVFGLTNEPGEPPEDPFEALEERAEETPAAEAAPEEPTPDEQPEPALDEAEETPEVEATEEEEPEGTPYAGRYGEKYRTVEAFEEAHRNALNMHQQSAEKARLMEEQNRQLVEYLRIAADVIKEREQPKKPEIPADLKSEAERYGVDPEQFEVIRKVAENLVEQRITPMQEEQRLSAEEQQRQLYAQQEQEQARTAIMNFKSAHPDLDEDTEQQMVQIFNHPRLQLDPRYPENYDIALEAAQNPELLSVLVADPEYVDTDEGLELARRLAGTRTATAPASREGELAAARKRATVEKGNSGAAAPTGTPAGKPEDDPDSWEAVLAVAAKDRGRSAFGV